MGSKEQIINDIRDKVIKGLNKTYENLLEMKKKNNGVIVISENGHIVRIKLDNK